MGRLMICCGLAGMYISFIFMLYNASVPVEFILFLNSALLFVVGIGAGY